MGVSDRLRSSPPRLHLAAVAPALMAVLGGASIAAPSETPAAECRLIVGTATEPPPTATLARAIARRAGLPVRRLDPIAGRLFALRLDATSEAACRHATEALAADHALLAQVDPDRRRRLPERPTASSAR